MSREDILLKETLQSEASGERRGSCPAQQDEGERRVEMAAVKDNGQGMWHLQERWWRMKKKEDSLYRLERK